MIVRAHHEDDNEYVDDCDDSDDADDSDDPPWLSKLSKSSNFMHKLFLLCYPQCPEISL